MLRRTYTIAASLFLVLAIQVGATAAATHTSAAGAGAALKGKVTISVKGTRGEGRFIISGAISDRGRYVDREGVISHRTLFGAKGAISMKVGYTSPYPCQCNWRITKGTKAYAGLQGRGTETGSYTATTNIRMTGTVSK